jgi:hypothetical protein
MNKKNLSFPSTAYGTSPARFSCVDHFEIVAVRHSIESNNFRSLEAGSQKREFELGLKEGIFASSKYSSHDV